MYDADTLLADLCPVRRSLSSRCGAIFHLSGQLGPSRAWLMAGAARICYSSSMVKP